MRSNINVPRESLVEFCRRRRIKRLSFFGSVLRQDFTPESDVDVLVEFESGTIVGFFELHDIEGELSRILGDRKVDLHTPGGLSRYIRDRVLGEAEVQYDAA
ncbi:nucleotidyltransferase family protein [Candidatus Poribacteria bacterium]|nr:nucleotidyltransferase family protein [Candidatus Poribacteria bacterium]